MSSGCPRFRRLSKADHERVAQLRALITEGGDSGECAEADLRHEYPELFAPPEDEESSN
jgi:hypothetical protein